MDVVTYALARAYADRLSSGEPAEMRRSGDWIEWRRVGELEWHQLVPLVDIAGPQGLQGIQGPKGEKGDTGEGLKVLGSFDAPEDLPSSNNEVGDAYLISQHLWVWDGDEWVDTGTIQGPKGDTGKSAYQEAVDNGFEGDVEDWLLSLKGEKGDTGEQGPTGAGVPAGGVTGQAMVKASEDDYDTEWSDVIPSRLGPVSPTVDLDNVSESGWSSDGTSAVETIVFDSGRTQTRYGENGLIESRTHDGAEWTEWVRASGTDIQAGDGISVTGDESEPVVSVDDSVMRLDRAETVTGEKTVTTIKVTNSGSIAPSSDNGSFTVGSSASTRPNVQLSGPNNRGQLRVGTTVAATWTNTGLHAGDSNAPGDLLATRSYVDDFNVLPDGGTTGQVLSKASDDDGDATWTDPPAGGVQSDDVEYIVELTQAEYDSLASPDPETLYIITDAEEPETELENGSVTTPKIEDGAVTTPKLADNAVTPEKSARLGYRTVTANTTLALGDVDGVVEVNSESARTVTLPTDASVAFLGGTVIEIVRWGTGAVTISPASGVSLRSPDGEMGARNIASQYGSAFLRKRGTNNWHLSGDLE